MPKKEIESQFLVIESEVDPCERTLRLAKLLTGLFSERGFDVVVTGGSAIELLTDGRYTSGDLDLCFESGRPPLRTIAEVMQSIGATGGTRTFRRGRLFIDVLGEIETLARTPFRKIDGVRVAKPEDLIPERTLMSVYPCSDEPSRLCVEKILATVFCGALEVDWQETERVASLPEYRVLDELQAIRSEVAKRLEEEKK